MMKLAAEMAAMATTKVDVRAEGMLSRTAAGMSPV
jgi:hypothetical protein